MKLILTKPVLGLMAASVVVAGGAGFMAGKASSASKDDLRGADHSQGAESGNPLRVGFDDNNANASASGARSTSPRLLSGKPSDTSWHQYTGPFTAESWMAIRQSVLATSLDQVEDTLARLAMLPVSEERMRLQREVLALWATRDPLAALEFAGGISIKDERTDAREDILKVWAGREPKAAFDWLEAQKEVMPAGEYNRLFDDAMRGYADLNLSEAINYFNTLSDSLDRRQSRSGINEIMESMIQQGRLTDASKFIDQFTDPEIRQQASRELMSELASVDVNQALDLLNRYQGTEAHAVMQRELVAQWAENDPAAAAKYMTTSVQAGEGFSDMASQVIRNWDDITLASEWLAQYDPSPELDRPTMMLAFRAAGDDPEGAVSWVGSVTDDNMRDRGLRMVASNWKVTDEAALNQFLAQNQDLTPEQKKMMQEAPARSVGGWGRGWGGRR